MELVSLSWSQCLLIFPQGSRPFKHYAKSTMPALYKWNNKAWITACLFITWFTEFLSLLLNTANGKKDSFQNIIAHDNASVTQECWWRYITESVFFMPANITFTLQLMDQGLILAFKSYYLSNTFYKVIIVTGWFLWWIWAK